MRNDDHVATVRRLIDAIGALEIDAALALTTDDLVLELPFRADGGSRRLEGEEARRFIRAMPRLFVCLPFPEVSVHGELPSGQVVAEYRSEGLTRSGRRYANSYVGFFGMRDGRIAWWREYFDPNVVADAFAVDDSSSPPGGAPAE